MVDCPRDDIRDLLPDLVHDQLEPQARVRVEQHLADCAACTAELELLRALRASAFATPRVDADRIAAAVRDAMAGSGADAPRDSDVGESDLVPIGEARRRHGNAVHRAPRRPVIVGIPQSWRIAAGIALVAAGVGGYALTRGGPASPQRSMERATVAASESAPAAATSAVPQRGEAKAAAPAPAAPMMASDAAGAAESGVGAAAAAPGALILGDAMNELSESDMQALLQSVDDLEAMPDLEPHQLPLLASVVEGAL